MGSPSERKLSHTDYGLIRNRLTDMVVSLKASDRKAMYKHMDVDAALTNLFEMQHVYILDEAYLVAYELGTPWYVQEDIFFLEEQLVLRLAVSGDFGVVPAFLERKAREAGAVLAIAGTALAKADTALASLYHRAGYSTQALTLVKEP